MENLAKVRLWWRISATLIASNSGKHFLFLELLSPTLGTCTIKSNQKGRKFIEPTSSSENKLSDYEVSDNEEFSTKTAIETDDKNSQNSRESTPGRDSVVKEYWSRISKRASSLDSDLGMPDKPPDQNEGWMFFKDFKGKLTKTLEERKSSISRGVKDDKAPSESDPENKKNLDDIDYDSTPTENVIDKLSCKLSPAIEAAEVESDNSLFADYIDNRLEKLDVK
ncbi:hypothetical protein CEXT_175811 [Caerostris extrusa]|uniref:Uncharacterized protein n=1 Tax=Caerostris extrusa TaxID=172846 RepID=A0AAV4Y0V0_CAEEX|nr:hypothetical protein CEXT_175811 [Caerostris extrusa]